MKKYISISLLLTIVILVGTSCEWNSAKRIETEESTSYSYTELELAEKKKEYSENGYPIENYKIIFTEEQKKSNAEVEGVINENFYEDEFLIRENLIDSSKKINLIPFKVSYIEKDELFGILFFLINTSSEKLMSLKMEAALTVNNIKDIPSLEYDLQGENFAVMQPGDVIIIGIRGNIPVDSADRLMASDSNMSLEAKNLEINGKKTENLN